MDVFQYQSVEQPHLWLTIVIGILAMVVLTSFLELFRRIPSYIFKTIIGIGFICSFIASVYILDARISQHMVDHSENAVKVDKLKGEFRVENVNESNHNVTVKDEKNGKEYEIKHAKKLSTGDLGQVVQIKGVETKDNIIDYDADKRTFQSNEITYEMKL